MQWQFHMQRFAKNIVGMMKSEGLYASQGGPIILSQVIKFVGLDQRNLPYIFIKLMSFSLFKKCLD
jgi:hypothetical protein